MKKHILFVCTKNSCRSQMAEALYNHLAKEKASAQSAGTNPAKSIDRLAVQVMDELNIDMSHQFPKLFSFDMNNRFDIIVTMGCIEGCPITPRVKTVDWNIEDPEGKTIEKFREVRDDIRARIVILLAEMSN